MRILKRGLCNSGGWKSWDMIIQYDSIIIEWQRMSYGCMYSVIVMIVSMTGFLPLKSTIWIK